MNLDQINVWTEDEASAQFKRCCGSTRWSLTMAQRRPFDTATVLLEFAERTWWDLSHADWLEALAAHPRIGDLDALRAKFASTAEWASREQAGALAGSDDVLGQIAQGNRDYEARFGYIFIVCATGKSAAEMLQILQQRLPNDPETEIKLAAGEQMKITRIRLERIAP
jgi:2-oxo-4-hydroxy-4-carboxy-5-ureidoimidazoline decarboxylase